MNTTKFAKIAQNIKSDKELSKRLENDSFFDVETFIRNSERYIKAIKQGRMFCIIHSVSSSGMSRVIEFAECSGKGTNYNFLNFYGLFNSLGYMKSGNGFRINGCGMDVVFNTNYCIIHKLHGLGFISSKECALFAQKTPCKF
jgi:hypothetical protein